MKHGKKIDGEWYSRRSQHIKKSKAQSVAQSYRNVGAKARVIKEITEHGTLWVVYRRG